MITADDHRRRYPNARPSTIAYLIKRDKTNAALIAEVKEKRRQERIERIKRSFRLSTYLWSR